MFCLLLFVDFARIKTVLLCRKIKTILLLLFIKAKELYWNLIMLIRKSCVWIFDSLDNDSRKVNCINFSYIHFLEKYKQSKKQNSWRSLPNIRRLEKWSALLTSRRLIGTPLKLGTYVSTVSNVKKKGKIIITYFFISYLSIKC